MMFWLEDGFAVCWDPVETVMVWPAQLAGKTAFFVAFTGLSQVTVIF